MNLTLPSEITALFDEITARDFAVGIVGGFCRDYLHTGKISRDIDVEIRPLNKTDTSELYSFIQDKYNAKLLNYNILSVSFGEFSVEMGMPRVEIFNGQTGHSNFDVEFIQDLDYTEGFKRRDFTINAILFLYKEKKWSIVDPMGGVNDLETRSLVECNRATFSKDPVRVLRALRFSLKMNFTLSQYLKEQLESFDSSTATSHYLKMEATKSKKPICFLIKILDLNNLLDETESFDEDLELMVKMDPRIGLQDKQSLVSRLGLSKKGVIKLEINSDINALLKSSFGELENSLILFEKAKVSPLYLAFLLDNYFINFNLASFKKFQTSSYELSKEDKQNDPSLYKRIILTKRIEKLC